VTAAVRAPVDAVETGAHPARSPPPAVAPTRRRAGRRSSRSTPAARKSNGSEGLHWRVSGGQVSPRTVRGRASTACAGDANTAVRYRWGISPRNAWRRRRLRFRRHPLATAA